VEKSWAWVWWHVFAIPAMAGSIKQDCGPGWPELKVRPYLKNNEQKGLEAGLKCLDHKCEALTSNPITAKKKTL
jgi:hypothetical protein